MTACGGTAGRALFRAAPAAMAVLDGAGRVEEANPALARLLGRGEDELAGVPLAGLAEPDDRAEVEAALRRAREGGEPAEAEARWRGPRGAGPVLRLAAAPLPPGSGAEDGARIVATLEDVTAARAAEATLRRERDFAVQAIEALGQGLTITGLDARIRYANPAFARMVGRTPEALQGATPYDFTHPDDVGRLDEARARRLAGESSSYETRLLRPDGAVVHAYITGVPLLHDGEMAGSITAISNLTQRKRIEEALRASERRYKELVETASDLIYGTDAEGRFTYANPSAARIVGHPAERLVGTHFSELLRPDVRGEVVEFYRRQLRERRPDSYLEFPLVRADGGEAWIGQHVRLVEEGGRVAGTRAVARDITERHRAEEDKDRLLALVGHELRTPLTSVRGALGLLAGGRLGRLPEEGRRMVEVALRNTARLIRLVDEILDLERLRTGRMELVREPRDAGELVAEAAGAVREAAERAGVRLTLEAERSAVRGDPDRVIRVLVNLLSNAVKFSPPGEEVVVRARRGDGEARFEVADRGRGIPPERVDALWDRSARVDASDARRGGLGLGLAISRGIVERHGGRIGVRSRPGEGSTFWFTIPDASPDPPG